MNMQSKNQIAACRFLQLIYNLIVPNMVGNQLIFPVAKGVGAGSAHPKAQLTRNMGNISPQGGNIFIGFFYVFTDIGTYFHHCLVHLGFHLIPHDLLTFLNNALFVTF